MKNITEQQISGRQVAVTLTLWIVGSILVGTGTYFVLQSWAPQWATADNQAITIVAEVYFLFLVIVFAVFGGLKGFRDRLNFRFTSVNDIWLALKLYLLILAAVVITYFILSSFLGPLPGTFVQVLHHASDMSRLSTAGFAAWFLIIIRACILAPLTEELLFRGLLFGWLRSRVSAKITIFLTTLLFAGMHYYLILMPLAFFFGLASGWLRERTGSSFNFSIAHIANSILFLAAAYILVTKFGM